MPINMNLKANIHQRQRLHDRVWKEIIFKSFYYSLHPNHPFKKYGCDMNPTKLNGFPSAFQNTPLLKDNSLSPECIWICRFDTERGTLDWETSAHTASIKPEDLQWGEEKTKQGALFCKTRIGKTKA